MTNEKILEIANRYTAPETESRILFDKDGNATGGTVTMTYWNFCEEELIAFAKSVIEADRESSDETVGDFGLVMELCAALEIASYSIQDEEAKRSAIGACNYGRNRVKYRRPAPARKPLSEDSIDKAYDDMCHVDSWSDFREGVRWAEKMHGIGETE